MCLQYYQLLSLLVCIFATIGKTEHPIIPLSESLAIHKILDKLRHDLGYYTADEEEELSK